jgi:phospholipid/cholesterol/gamma-HCH transport system substrate-binding protein
MSFLRRDNKNGRPTVLRKDRTGANPITVGLIALVVIGLICYFGFTKNNPFSQPFQFKAVFSSANSIRLSSPVRIAGVNVGKVVKVEGQEGTNNAVVTMEMQNQGLPIHKDAELKIRSRIFLEGNFFVDLKPGTPQAPTISEGETIPAGQTATPVQLDQVLTSLQQDTRKNLQVLLIELGAGLTAKPTAAENAEQPRMTQGKSAAEALNNALIYSEPALKNSALVNQALQGINPDDLPNLIRGLAATSTKLVGSEAQLGDLVDNFNTTVGAIASEQSSVRESVKLLGPTVKHAYASLGSLNDALPSLAQFSLDFIPGVEQTQPTIDAVTPWIAQATPLVSQPELGGVAANLQPSTESLAQLSAATIPALTQTLNFSQCVSNVLIPTGDMVVPDGAFSTGKPNYQEFWDALAGFNGESQSFDANGQMVRLSAGGGPNAVKITGGNLNAGQPLYGNSIGAPQGTKPAWTSGQVIPTKPNELCSKQTLPDIANTPTGPAD